MTQGNGLVSLIVFIFFSEAGSIGPVNLVYTTLYWATGILTLVSTILRGEARVICSKFDPTTFCCMIEKCKVGI